MLPRTVICLLIPRVVRLLPSLPTAWVWGQPSIALAQQYKSRNLSPEEARAARSVKLTGVVTHINPYRYDFFLQDASAGIYVKPTQPLAVGLTLERCRSNWKVGQIRELFPPV